jgi:LmbE family N-acetylglucosaminyl deacetylase
MSYTIVFFHAHPDDEAIATGGTMARASREGHRVVLVSATRGELGEFAPDSLAPGEQLVDRRVAELNAAAEILGVDRVEFLGYRDSGMAGEPTSTRRPRGSPGFSRRSTPTCSRSTTRTATTATRTTSR